MTDESGCRVGTATRAGSRFHGKDGAPLQPVRGTDWTEVPQLSPHALVLVCPCLHRHPRISRCLRRLVQEVLRVAGTRTNTNYWRPSFAAF